MPRHPSIEEAVEVLSRRTDAFLEANWLIVDACHDKKIELPSPNRRENKENISIFDDSCLDRMAIELLNNIC